MKNYTQFINSALPGALIGAAAGFYLSRQEMAKKQLIVSVMFIAGGIFAGILTYHVLLDKPNSPHLTPDGNPVQPNK